MGFIHLDTGAMYRGITLKFIREKVDLSDLNKVNTVLKSTQLEFKGKKNDFPLSYDKKQLNHCFHSNE